MLKIKNSHVVENKKSRVVLNVENKKSRPVLNIENKKSRLVLVVENKKSRLVLNVENKKSCQKSRVVSNVGNKKSRVLTVDTKSSLENKKSRVSPEHVFHEFFYLKFQNFSAASPPKFQKKIYK